MVLWMKCVFWAFVLYIKCSLLQEIDIRTSEGFWTSFWWKMTGVFFVFHIIAIFSTTRVCFGTQELWDHLFVNNNYNKYLRPTRDWTHPTHVNFSLSIIAVVEFDEVKETIIITGKLSLSWIDEFLQWDPENFSNVSHIHLPQSEVWKPYMVLENSVKGETELGTPSLQVLVHSSGRIDWRPIQVFHTTCAADVQKFPFDTQVCAMTFEASGYEKSEIELDPVNDHIEFHEYGGTSGWTITETSVSVDEDGEEFHMLCSIKMKRNPVYFLLNIFLPISLLSFLNICVFILPVESGEKASFVVTVFLSLAVFLTIVSGKLPENSEAIAFLNIYVFISTLLSTIIAIVTIVQIRIYNRSQAHKVPHFLAKLSIYCTSSDKQHDCVAETLELKTEHGHTKTKVQPIDTDKYTNNHDQDSQETKIDRNVITVTWRRLVKALDNICFVVFLIINITMTTVILVLATQDETKTFTTGEDHQDH